MTLNQTKSPMFHEPVFTLLGTHAVKFHSLFSLSFVLHILLCPAAPCFLGLLALLSSVPTLSFELDDGSNFPWCSLGHASGTQPLFPYILAYLSPWILLDSHSPSWNLPFPLSLPHKPYLPSWWWRLFCSCHFPQSQIHHFKPVIRELWDAFIFPYLLTCSVGSSFLKCFQMPVWDCL